MEKKTCKLNKRSLRAKLIFNPSAGAARVLPIEIVDVIHEMQTWNIIPEAYLIEPNSDLSKVVENAHIQGIRKFVVCRGVGTISSVA